MAKTFDLIVFDWDGTLMDSTAHIVNAIQHASVELGLPMPDTNAARQVIGLSLGAALKQACPDLPEARYQEMAAAYSKHFVASDESVVLFDGVDHGLRQLEQHGVTLAVATGKSRRGLTRALEATGLGERFAATRTQDDCPSKPHPAMLLELMALLDVSPERTLMVGDTTYDLQMAQLAGTHSVGVSYGAHERVMLESCAPLEIFEEFSTLQQWLLTQIS